GPGRLTPGHARLDQLYRSTGTRPQETGQEADGTPAYHYEVFQNSMPRTCHPRCEGLSPSTPGRHYDKTGHPHALLIAAGPAPAGTAHHPEPDLAARGHRNARLQAPDRKQSPA